MTFCLPPEYHIPSKMDSALDRKVFAPNRSTLFPIGVKSKKQCINELPPLQVYRFPLKSRS